MKVPPNQYQTSSGALGTWDCYKKQVGPVQVEPGLRDRCVDQSSDGEGGENKKGGGAAGDDGGT